MGYYFECSNCHGIIDIYDPVLDANCERNCDTCGEDGCKWCMGGNQCDECFNAAVANIDLDNEDDEA